jgi:ribosomal protein L3 glutamine methyltransferase
MPAELLTIIDLIRFGASRFGAASLTFGHSYDNALDEATQLTLHALHLPHDLSPVYGQARVTGEEKERCWRCSSVASTSAFRRPT